MLLLPQKDPVSRDVARRSEASAAVLLLFVTQSTPDCIDQQQQQQQQQQRLSLRLYQQRPLHHQE